MSFVKFQDLVNPKPNEDSVILSLPSSTHSNHPFVSEWTSWRITRLATFPLVLPSRTRL